MLKNVSLDANVAVTLSREPWSKICRSSTPTYSCATKIKKAEVAIKEMLISREWSAVSNKILPSSRSWTRDLMMNSLADKSLSSSEWSGGSKSLAKLWYFEMYSFIKKS